MLHWNCMVVSSTVNRWTMYHLIIEPVQAATANESNWCPPLTFTNSTTHHFLALLKRTIDLQLNQYELSSDLNCTAKREFASLLLNHLNFALVVQ
jgi:hypothetical protein